MSDIKQFHIHLISDATGTTLQGLARACLAQFKHIEPIERFWPLVRSEKQLERVMEDIVDYPGPVLFTLVNADAIRSGVAILFTRFYCFKLLAFKVDDYLVLVLCQAAKSLCHQY